MATSNRSKVLSKARSQVGYQRKASRWNKYAADVYPTVQNQPYCGIFVAWVIIKATGFDVRKVCWLPFVPSIEQWARKNGAWKTKGQKNGDLVVFGFGKSSAQHVGFAWRDEKAKGYRSVEGNTTPGTAGSQANGGGVHVRYRRRSQIRGWVDLDKLVAAAGGAKASVGTKKQPWEKSPRIQGMSKAEVKRIQQMLVDAGNSVGKYGVDGSYKADTFNAVKRVQKALGLTVDGVFGPATEKALAAHIKSAGKKPAAKPKAPPFPLPRKKGAMYYYGPPSGPKTSVSGKGRNTGVPNDVVRGGKLGWYSKGLMAWQKAAGIAADGRYGSGTRKKILALQKAHGLKQDGKIGPATWVLPWA